MITVAAYDRQVEQLFELMRRIHAALTMAEVDYRIVGGMAVFFQVSERDPDAARLTRDVHVAIDRNDIQRLARAAEDFGFRYRHAAGVDMLVDAKQPNRAAPFTCCSFVRKCGQTIWRPYPDSRSPPSQRKAFCLLPYPICSV